MIGQRGMVEPLQVRSSPAASVMKGAGDFDELILAGGLTG